jgi:hypothetical protein
MGPAGRTSRRHEEKSMIKRPTPVRSWLAAAMALALLVAPVGMRSGAALGSWPGREGIRDAEGRAAPALAPIYGDTSWSDPLDDASGLSLLVNAQQSAGQVSLNRSQPLSGDVSGIQSLVEGPDGVFYMGTDESRLWSYDPATGVTTDLGLPVPDECDN